MKRDYRNKTIIITGAGGGLGAALCDRFAQAGACIGGIDVSETGLAATRARVEAAGAVFSGISCNITDETAVQHAISDLERVLGSPTYALINNAGITHLKRFAADQSDPLRRVMAVNYFGAVHCTAATIEQIRTQQGQIIAIASVAGYAPLVGRTGYSASKHAMMGFFGTLRNELHDSGVNVLLVCPSAIQTNIRKDRGIDAIEANHDRFGGDSPATIADQIYRAAATNKRLLSTGRVGKIAWWVWKLAPRFYERQMRARAEPDL